MARRRRIMLPGRGRIPQIIPQPDAPIIPMPAPPGNKDALEAAKKNFEGTIQEDQARTPGSVLTPTEDDALNKYILEVNQAWGKMPRSHGQSLLDVARDKYTARVRQALTSGAPDGGQAAISRAWRIYEAREMEAMPYIWSVLGDPEQDIWREYLRRCGWTVLGAAGPQNAPPPQSQQSGGAGGSGIRASQFQNASKLTGSAAGSVAPASVARSVTRVVNGNKTTASGSGMPVSTQKLRSAAGASDNAKTKPKETSGKLGGSGSGTPKPSQGSNAGSGAGSSGSAKTKPKDTKALVPGGAGSGGGSNPASKYGFVPPPDASKPREKEDY